MPALIPSPPHEHHYLFLRQETHPTIQWGESVRERLTEDVFYCEGCLDYRKVPVRREVPRRDAFGWLEIPV